MIRIYIPHSSDKTAQLINGRAELHQFTFHIVQIKLARLSGRFTYSFRIYIPHSSDKTGSIYFENYPRITIYIPHSSDKT